MTNIIAPTLIKNEVKTIISEIQLLKTQLSEMNKIHNVADIITNISKLRSVVINIVVAVELASSKIKNENDQFQKLPSQEKLNLAVMILDDAIKLPFWAELFDEHILKIIVSLIVEQLNKEFGHDWNTIWINNALDIGCNFDEYVRNKVYNKI